MFRFLVRERPEAEPWRTSKRNPVDVDVDADVERPPRHGDGVGDDGGGCRIGPGETRSTFAARADVNVVNSRRRARAGDITFPWRRRH